MMWTKTMQCAVGIFVLTIVAGAFYRPASMYHPRRKMIMHIKNQKKTRRDQEEVDPPYFDFSALRMRGLQALMIISSIAAFGIFVPFIILVKTILRFKLVKICNFTDYCYTCLFSPFFHVLKNNPWSFDVVGLMYRIRTSTSLYETFACIGMLCIDYLFLISHQTDVINLSANQIKILSYRQKIPQE